MNMEKLLVGNNKLMVVMKMIIVQIKPMMMHYQLILTNKIIFKMILNLKMKILWVMTMIIQIHHNP